LDAPEMRIPPEELKSPTPPVEIRARETASYLMY
jgi:hypothetical protein